MNPVLKLAGGRHGTRHGLLITASLVAMAACPIAANAQASQDSTEAIQTSDAEIIVTGSRASLNGFSAPSPTQVIGADLIAKQGASTVAEVLQQEPAFKATRSAGGNANNFANPGQATADLRGLGGQRTLVLVNGSRIVPQAPSNNTGVPVTTDLNVIPTNMIDRVEVVTGGASAQYGSDAVAGVVNILLKKRFKGIELTASSGISQYGDNFKYRLGAIGGIDFADGRGHLVASIEATESGEINDLYSRAWGAQEWMIVTNANFATNGLPANIVAPFVKNNNSIGGKILGPANFSLRNYTFNADGTIRPYDAGSLNNGTYQIGGEGLSRNTGSSLIPGVRRLTTYARAEYAFSEAAILSAEGGYTRTLGLFTGGLPNIASFTIQRDNAYLPQVVRDAMIAQNVTSFTMSKGFYDMGNINFRVRNETPHMMVALEGDLGHSWHYDAHYSYGKNIFQSDFTNNFAPVFYAFAADAVQVGNTIVCRGVRDNVAAAAGCIPLNIFGPQSTSRSAPGAQDYVNRSGYSRVGYVQHAAAANVRGEPFATWAGPVSIAFGGEWRRETQKLTADALSTAGRFLIGNATPFAGKFDVKEGYFETLVPLARDVSFAHSFDINGAIRYADYSTAGGQTTWKLGAVYEPVEGLRFRATRSRDIRAPAIYELFSPGSTLAAGLTVRGINANIPQNRSIGNPNLRPEVANTLTLGVVLQPSGIPGLRASVDYFRIDLRDAIDSLTAANIGNFCTAGQQLYCSFITFAPNGTPLSLAAPVQNIASFKSSGLDFALSYRMGLGGGSALTTRFSGTYALHNWINGVDRAGENGLGSLGAVPRFRGNLQETFDTGPLSLTAQLLYISKGNNDNTFNTIPALTINQNEIAAAAYVNLFSTIKIDERMEITASIDNLLNRDPPVSPYATQGQAVNGQYYDKVGRAFEVGVRIKFP
ncbi:TonB-dependent receptor [Sphingobium nicotianae]|uniref:TonB-dependent receptor n=1 Tax=Sphingobium nicotianae TaxID=2782607 RepID=A0A9X1DA88_9SPHN|nr:TonB-dependent receptor [Sphingobium nicotianae]MBT2186230.1 TonB-dependent receptor [Sphingobium nicotianae]